MDRPDFEDIVENTSDGIMAVDSDLTVTVFNQSMERLSEVSREQALLNPLDKLFPADPWLNSLIEETIEHKRFHTDIEEKFQRRISDPVSVSVSSNPIYDTDGHVIGAMAFIKDISTLKAASADKLRRDRLSYIGTFATKLAHELKNPLSGIRGAAQLLERKVDSAELKEFTGVIVGEADRLNLMVRDMLDFTRPRRLITDKLNIHKILDHVLMLSVDEDSGKITREYDPSLPPVMADEGQVTQVFLNLVKNALEAVMEKAGDGGEIRLSTRIVTDRRVIPGSSDNSADEKFVVIEITDNGSGIAAEEIEKIFTPFYTTKPGGSGLGMGITYHIIEEHGGFMDIDSTVGEGCRVSVYLKAATSN